jgi:hypothetical protein
MRCPALILSLACLLPGGVVIDRIAAVAGKHVIKLSDIERDLRLTNFLNREPLAINAQSKRKAAERLVDQAVIRDEIATGGYTRATDADAAGMLQQIRKDRYSASDARLRQALTQYGLTEDELRAELLWQLTVLRFIEQRFRPGVLVSDEDLRAYYDQHLSDLKRQYPRDNTFESLEAKIRALIEGERINEQFEQWLEGARRRDRVEFRQGAFE